MGSQLQFLPNKFILLECSKIKIEFKMFKSNDVSVHSLCLENVILRGLDIFPSLTIANKNIYNSFENKYISLCVIEKILLIQKY